MKNPGASSPQGIQSHFSCLYYLNNWICEGIGSLMPFLSVNSQHYFTLPEAMRKKHQTASPCPSVSCCHIAQDHPERCQMLSIPGAWVPSVANPPPQSLWQPNTSTQPPPAILKYPYGPHMKITELVWLVIFLFRNILPNDRGAGRLWTAGRIYPMACFLGDSQAKNGFRIFKELGRGEAAIESACGLQSLYLLFGPL